MPDKVEISTADDFVVLVLDGVDLSFDLLEAQDQLAKIDVRHNDDPWLCFTCKSSHPKPPDEEIKPEMACPSCGATGFRRNDDWLDDVAAYVVRSGAARCSRAAAIAVYNTICDRLDAVKKKPMVTPESGSSSA